MNPTSNLTLRQRIAEIRDLPTLPRVAMQILDLLSDPFFSPEALEQVLSQDPSLSAKMLQMANSAYYSPRHPVESIRRAMLVLGSREIQQIVLSLAVYRVFSGTVGRGAFDREKFWEHSATAAVIARAFALKLRVFTNRALPDEAEVAFSAGLLHDLGKIVLDTYFSEDFLCALSLAETEKIQMHEAERRVLGEDHAAIGAWLANYWRLPENLTAAIEYHHQPEKASQYQVLVICAQFGNLFSKVGGIGFGADEARIEFCNLPSWTVLQTLIPELKSVDIERFTFELDDDFDKARQLLEALRR